MSELDYKLVGEILLAAFDVIAARSEVAPEKLVAAFPTPRQDHIDWNLSALNQLPNAEREAVLSLSSWANEVLSLGGERVLPVYAKL